MNFFLQLTLIVVLGNYVTSDETFHEHCVMIKNENLHITPNNSIVKGEGIVHNNEWYKYVNWLETPAGDLTLSYKIEFWGNDCWNLASENSLDVFAEGRGEWYNVAQFVRKALGLNHQRAKIPGKVRVPSKLFASKKCTVFRFRRIYHETYNYRIFLDVVDDDDNRILTGYVKIPPME